MSGDYCEVRSKPIVRSAQNAAAVTSFRPSLAYLAADVAAICVVLWLALRLPASDSSLVILAIYAVLFGFLVRSILNACELQIDPRGLTVTTLLWRLRRLPPVWVERADELEVESCSLFWHSSLTIDGFHLELPGPGPLRTLRRALESHGIEVVETAPKGLRIVSPLAFLLIFVAAGLSIVAYGKDGVTICAAGWVLALVVSVTHSALVDRAWRRRLAHGRTTLSEAAGS